jgi:hypothetical protein
VGYAEWDTEIKKNLMINYNPVFFVISAYFLRYAVFRKSVPSGGSGNEYGKTL